MRKARILRGVALLAVIAVTLVFTGCAPKIAQPSQIQAPEPIYSNTGKFMSPYTSDGVLAEWVDNAIKAKAAGQIGGALGAYAGSQALKQVPFVGGMLGNYAGKKIGSEIAIKCAGGRDVICNSSDLSFNNLDKLSVFLYVKYSDNEHYKSALDATMAIYPDMKQRYSIALANASRGVM